MEEWQSGRGTDISHRGEQCLNIMLENLLGGTLSTWWNVSFGNHILRVNHALEVVPHLVAVVRVTKPCCCGIGSLVDIQHVSEEVAKDMGRNQSCDRDMCRLSLEGIGNMTTKLLGD